MSYHDLTPATPESRVGKSIYLTALDDRRGFRQDQIGIDDDLWEEIFDQMGRAAFGAVNAEMEGKL